MKINDLLTNENIENKKLALEQVLNLSKPELLLNKNKEITKQNYKEDKKISKLLWKRILRKQKHTNTKTRNRNPSP